MREESRWELNAGSCINHPPDIRHREIGSSNDVETPEIVPPAEFTTEEVDSIAVLA